MSDTAWTVWTEPDEAAGFIKGLDRTNQAHVWRDLPGRYDEGDAFDAFATIAGMRYEYAVLCLVEGDVWRYASAGMLITSLDRKATWLPTLEKAQEYAERRRRSAKATRIVRRLVSAPEVIE